MASDNESCVSDVEFQDEDIKDSGSESSFSEDTDNDSEDEGEPLREEAWRELDTFCPPAQPRFYFQGESSVNFVVAPGGSVLQYLELFLDDEVIGHITNEMNRYAAQCLSEKPSSSRPQWRDNSAAEIRVFFALIILQSIIQKPDQEQYWPRRRIFVTPFFGDTMSYRRFASIRQHLHFSNNEEYDPLNHPNPKLNKSWPIYHMLEEKFNKLYTPERDLTVDESLLLYKG
ncbi:hypothetical protein J437_LFUL017303 [Ladona fulva]|uniref:PiggyBac transposable element-derived protein domain-containing protein n=1 Tax=Ladona fulva TaxID=123851 RepID=A0A8K0KGL9_LADFU|nr:hypothetical protein J437_LFUL017303 [Ladona fulva]